VDLPKDLLASLPPQHYDPKMVKACYYAEIELVDKQFGRILDTLKETGQLENTIVIFTSDHGELLGDHGLLFKGCRFFEALVHVPLIISWPKKWQKNCVSNALVESIDIAPTILQAAGLEIPYFVQGKPLNALLEGTSEIHHHKESVLCEYNDAMGQGTTANKHKGSHATMVFDGEYKSVVYCGEEIGEIYNLKNDPGEFDNLWNKDNIQDLKIKILQKHLDRVMRASSAGIRRTKAY
jgi:arylsulfatase A-like enzyme